MLTAPGRPDNLQSPAPAHKSQSDLLTRFCEPDSLVSYALIRKWDHKPFSGSSTDFSCSLSL